MGQRREHQMEWVDEHGSRLVRNWVSPSPGKPFFLNVPSVGRFLGHYGNHQGLANRLIEAIGEAANSAGEVVRESRLGGLLNYYRRAAWAPSQFWDTTPSRVELWPKHPCLEA